MVIGDQSLSVRGGGGLFPTAPWPRIKSLKLYIIRVGSNHSLAHRK